MGSGTLLANRSDPDQEYIYFMGSETDGQTDMARSTRLVILIKNIYTLWGRNRFLLPVTYFPTNLVYPFTLRVTGIKIGCFLLPVTYFPTNLVYPFTLRVRGIIIKSGKCFIKLKMLCVDLSLKY